jgi:hypothetical protein
VLHGPSFPMITRRRMLAATGRPQGPIRVLAVRKLQRPTRA